MATTANKSVASLVIKMAAVLAMKQPERVNAFAAESAVAQRAFAATGKYYRGIEANLTKKDKGIFPLLLAAGVKKGNISNASYAAKVFDLVEKGILTEADYDSFTFQDCVAIVRAQSKLSKRQLTTAEIAVAIKASPDFAVDLDALYEHGCTAAEKAVKDKAAEADRKRVEQESKENAEKEKEELEKLRKENAALKTTADAPAPGNDADAPDDDDDQSPADADDDAPDAPDAAPSSKSTTAAKAAAAAELSADDVLAMIEDVELALAELSGDAQTIVVARILELAETVKTPAKPAKKPATAKGKGKKVAA